MSNRNEGKEMRSSTYKLPPKEMMVTRRKSAQLKRQLRDERPNSKLAEPKKPPKSPKTAPKSEYRPEKVKRKIKGKEIILKPRANYVKIAATNKRKLTTPQKQNTTSSSPLKLDVYSKQACYHNLTICEVIRLKEDTEELTEDDLMEILTCPSPVWWEADVTDEEAVSIQSASGSRQKQSSDNQSLLVKRNLEQSFAKSESFHKKCSSLEGVLTNIKCKVDSNEKTDETLEIDDKVIDDLENIDIPVEKSSENPSQSEPSSSDCENGTFLGAGKDTHCIDPSNGTHASDAKAIGVNARDTKAIGINASDTKVVGANASLDTEIVPLNLPPLRKRPSIINRKRNSVDKETKAPNLKNFIESDAEIFVLNIVDPDTGKEKYVRLIDNLDWKDRFKDDSLAVQRRKKQTKKRKNERDLKKIKSPLDDSERDVSVYIKVLKSNDSKEKDGKDSKTEPAEKKDVKYCFVCSSVFDTDICGYCEKGVAKNSNCTPFACF